MGRADYVRLGSWNACCDQCGRKRKGDDLVKTWNGLWVCPEHWEPRHPQDFVRAVKENPTPFVIRKCLGIRLGDRNVFPGTGRLVLSGDGGIGVGRLVLNGGGPPTVTVPTALVYHHLTFTGASGSGGLVGDYYAVGDFATFGTYCLYLELGGEPCMFPYNTPDSAGNWMTLSKRMYTSLVFDFYNLTTLCQVSLWESYPVGDNKIDGTPMTYVDLPTTGGGWVRDYEIIIPPGKNVVAINWGGNLAQNQCAFDNIRYYTEA